MKKAIAILLTMLLLSSSFVCFAAELNEDAVAKHYGQYENYLLLGDSIASGYRDEILDGDADFNEANNETTYFRVPGSYADVLANAIIEDKSMTALAAPGYRTIEMRYMLEDDYAAQCDDEYLFHTSHLYVYEDMVCDCHRVNLLPGSEHFRDEFKKSIAEADLITLGIGGNDWGAYLSWVVADILEAENVADKYIIELEDFLKEAPLGLETIAKVVEIAHLAGALPTLLQELPARLNYGLSTFYSNWDIMIEDIYALNPDVTLMVLGMSDNSIKGKHYDYNGVVGEDLSSTMETDPMKAQVMSTIIGFIMDVGNAPLVEGANKFGYIYVDPDGASYVDSHPDEAGHVFIANKIIESLPDPDVFSRFEDVTPGHKYYKAVESVVLKGVMAPLSETYFGADEALTRGALTAAVNAINGVEGTSDDDAKVNALSFGVALLGASAKKGFVGFFKGITLMYKVLTSNAFSITAEITRGEAAYYLNQI